MCSSCGFTTVDTALCTPPVERPRWDQGGAWTSGARNDDLSDMDDNDVIEVDASQQVLIPVR